MTRENKLALIVAFALILGVSVLLSDHLSSARTMAPGELQETTRLPSVPQRPIRTLDDVVREARQTTPAHSPIDPVAAPDESANPMRLAGGSSEEQSSLLDDLLDGLGNARPAVSPEMAPPERTPDNSSGPLVLDQRMVREDPTGPTAPAARTGETAGVATPTGPVRNHSVKPGESLFAIANRYYGDGNLWRDLARFNAGRVKPDGSVNVGVVIRIPTKADLTGQPTPQNEGTATPPATPRREEAPARERTYTVAAGDTLGDIARSTLGTTRRWQEIYNLNKDRISDPNNVRAGVVLRLPGT